MSSIYIQEPPTNGKVLLKTTVGELEIELWSKEAPKTCRNFIQLCIDRFYDKTPFHRLIPNFIVQCGENSETADCIESIKNEFHSRLRFSRRGLVAMANNEGSENNMEFFFTLDATPELQNTHTIFGKVTGETIYNMIKLAESETDANDRPLYLHKINKVKILHNPFEDIRPRAEHRKESHEESEKRKKPKREGVKNFKLISFGDEAEQDEQEVESFPKETDKDKSKPQTSNEKSSRKEKERKKQESPSRTPPPKTEDKQKLQEDDSDSDYEMTLEKERLADLERKKKEIQDQIRDIKKEYHKDKKDKNKEEKNEKETPKPTHEDETIQDYLEEKEKYKKKKLTTKGASREELTLQLLAKFKNKLHSALESTADQPPQKQSLNEDSDDENWLSHKLDFSDSHDAVLAKDASKKQDDWYDIYDPRNPLNKRKRGAEKNLSTSGDSSKRNK
ncbi:CLUMA_CG000543, isoform A [Clunio marinus]|uniref:Spliceosome-associated protein CWC27 homolog n=1 Tax=Clunio marinus TaxID=568069 RepID=A0A1J1HJR2_9DIPT|nr:CLUMA_CG000543, isoform A [Clunio marinus]